MRFKSPWVAFHGFVDAKMMLGVDLQKMTSLRSRMEDSEVRITMGGTLLLMLEHCRRVMCRRCLSGACDSGQRG